MLEEVIRTLLILALVPAFIVWLTSYSKKEALKDDEGYTLLTFTPALYAYGFLMAILGIASLMGLALPFVIEMNGGEYLIFPMAVVFFVTSIWGLYAGYGGRVRYNEQIVLYQGVWANKEISWSEIHALRDGAFAQYICLPQEKLVLSKALRGFKGFAQTAKMKGVEVDPFLL